MEVWHSWGKRSDEFCEYDASQDLPQSRPPMEYEQRTSARFRE